ncbi:MAG TPA: DUF2071 domain-containing protein [Acidimicrobiales bacterium]
MEPETIQSPTRPGPWCPHTVHPACQIHQWNDLTFLHWRYDPDQVQRLLPHGLRVETFDGSAWVALVPFRMQVTLPHAPTLPWVSHFPETNVRTYVTGPDGTVGVWFLSLDASRLGAVAVARSTYHLPYFWSHMGIGRAGPVISYTSQRRWPGPVGARCEVAVEIGAAYLPGEATDLEHWLTARWRLFSATSDGLRHALADHPPWPLRHARVLHLDQDLVTAAGLPEPEGPPLVHWSPGVEVRVGFPRREGVANAAS